jgi:antitoxin component YwqK of YwqJK toxin-antitoxin module
MKSAFLLVLFMFVGIANAQEVCQYNYGDGNVQVLDNKTYYYKNELLNGVLCIDRGNMKMEYPYKNGVREGITKMYREGRLFAEIPFKNGLMEGIFKMYHESGSFRLKHHTRTICMKAQSKSITKMDN